MQTEAKLYDLRQDRDRLAKRVIPEALVSIDRQIAALEAEIAAAAAREALVEGIATGTHTKADLEAFDAQQRARTTDAEIDRRREALEPQRRAAAEAQARQEAAVELGPQLIKAAKKVEAAREAYARVIAEVASLVAETERRVGAPLRNGDLSFRDLSPEAREAFGPLCEAVREVAEGEARRIGQYPSLIAMELGATNRRRQQ